MSHLQYTAKSHHLQCQGKQLPKRRMAGLQVMLGQIILSCNLSYLDIN